MSGRRLTPAEHALVVLSVRRNNVAMAQALSAGYLYFVDDDDEAGWLDSLMVRSELIVLPPVVLPVDAKGRIDDPAFDYVRRND